MKIRLNEDRNPSFPFDELVAIFDTVEQASAVADALAGQFPDIEAVDILSGPDGVRIFDAAGNGHGSRAHLVRGLQHAGSGENELYLVDEALRGGRVLLRVPCSPADADAIGAVATAQGGQMVVWFGRHSMINIPNS
ncbi:hypothetical protein ATK17_2556 [Branchiibius hedensis]|uniref:Uncharacterized protein n=1 Tax=Branchiibius hedensis TaxID=672460 RepID=A0A2Y8ZUM9_9MICO|nr:hypothetical protein [Branchiibius hedensis]PWJ26394.1 hypothetical protein ATK17_2556 [Branchiibius hedensis]SSA35206.1 hypothetical protein SAMN04489750_2556 [Branchiibius hedensis]